MKYPVPWAVCAFAFFTLLGLQGEPLFAQAPLPGESPTAVQNYRIGRDLEANGRVDEANRYYDEAVRQCLDQVSKNTAGRDTYAAITWTLLRQMKYGEVVSWAGQGLKLFADDYRIVETLGEAYFHLNDFDRSLDCMQRYVNAVPQGERTSVAYFYIAEIFRLRRQYLHADIAYTTALRLSPGLFLWWYRLGLVREALKEYPGAVEAYQRALQINPGHSDSAAALARLQGQVN
ncbi:MAG: tetratricopeptide repeat protein [Treponema sp.]|jgi:tetratricopeptide (TPR) repeat protein|nr:tetratricopeptide repeat protein [Treponema sp.]